jgi:hypothetical protein
MQLFCKAEVQPMMLPVFTSYLLKQAHHYCTPLTSPSNNYST